MSLEQALAYIELGWAVFPVAPNAKRPLTPNGFKDATKSVFAAKRWWEKYPDANIGIATGMVSKLAVVDIDVKNGAKGRESIEKVKGMTPTLMAKTPSGGWHLYYLLEEPLKSRNGLLPGVDLKADGGYVVAPGSKIDDNPYEWFDAEAHLTALPNIVRELEENREHHAAPVLNGMNGHTNGAIPVGERNATLASLAGSMRRRGLETDEIAAALKTVNLKRCSPPLDDKEIENISASIARYPPEDAPVFQNGTHADSEEDEDIRPPGFTDDALALEFTEKHADDWRYVAAWGRWLMWDGAYWRNETTLKAYDLARLICRAASSRCKKPKIAAKVAGATTVAAVERMARADRKHAATTDQWNADAWRMNTRGGVVHLKTGEIIPHAREDYMTKMSNAIPRGDCPFWKNFLNDVTGGDEDLQNYLARVAGYALTGVTTEHALFFLYGTGANGKSVFVNTLAAILGDYATNAAMDTFMESRSDRHPTDLANLMGARLVTAIEVEKGRRWAESRIKSLTGGDKISARFMRQDFFEYKPQFKLLIAGNHKPAIRDVDEAMRRRLHLIPFTVTIPPERRDKTLPERLLQESDGIFKWALDGCLEWQRTGLNPPALVLSATEEYFESQDAMRRWMEDHCFVHPSVRCTTDDLFSSWKLWAEKWGEYAGTLQKFADDLVKKGFERWRSSRCRGFIGITVKTDDNQGEPHE
jgi:P4 family phage/plasmid primase-like protien